MTHSPLALSHDLAQEKKEEDIALVLTELIARRLVSCDFLKEALAKQLYGMVGMAGQSKKRNRIGFEERKLPKTTHTMLQ